jgi:hypothetical protein
VSGYKVLGTYIEKEMFESKAFLSLTGIAPQLLILFLGKRFIKIRKNKNGKKIKYCSNCDSIVFTYIEAKEKYGITTRRFLRAKDELLAKGFIRIKNPGGGFKKDKATYSISDQWCLWQPGMTFEVREKITTQKGFLNNQKSVAKTKATKTLKQTQRT